MTDEIIQKRINDLVIKAKLYNDEHLKRRKEIIAESREIVDLFDKHFRNEENDFRRKLYNYPNDITFIRIVKTFKDINAKKLMMENVISRL